MNYRHVERVRKDPATFKRIAAGLLALPHRRWSEYDQKFLTNISTRDRFQLSLRQAERLVEIENGAQILTTLNGLSVAILIDKCYLARFELSDDEDIAKIESLKRQGRTTVTGRQMGWFRRICIELGEVEDYM